MSLVLSGGELGKDSCKGDSGGGLYIQVKILQSISSDKDVTRDAVTNYQ